MRHHPSCWNKVLAKLGFRRIARRPKRQADLGRRLSRIESLEVRQMLTVTVDTLADVVDGGDGLTSLREAIAAAPASGNQVAFHSSLNGGVIELSGQLTITQSISIAGPGASMLTVQAAPGSGRVFHVASNAANVSISGLTITGGGSDKGGGVLNWGSLTLDRVASLAIRRPISAAASILKARW